ncbi:MAG TPA: ABC transporter permease [Acidimicrobiales bacterium]|jgi:ABC-type multidrug transport system permease subunit|nr:ABC transporter permease [Acidimicrobiales bacterium]
MMLHETVVAVGNEVDKGLRFGWAERKQIVLELTMFVPLFLLFAALAGQGDAIVAGRFAWVFDERRTAWLLVGWVLGMFFYLQAQKFFWRQLGEIQAGTLEQVYLSPLPWWLLAAVGRVVASILETVVVVGTLYAVVALTIGVDLDWQPAVVVPIGFLIVGAVGYSLAIGGLTLLWKRIEVLNDTLLIIVFFASGMMVALDDMPGWMAAVGRFLPVTHPIEATRSVLLDGDGLTLTGDGGLVWMAALAVGWFAAGVYAFHRAAQVVRRDGTLTRY